MAHGSMKVAVVGAGMGGLTLASALYQSGVEVAVYEQAPAFARVGAGIQMAPNALKALIGLGLSDDTVKKYAYLPDFLVHRESTGEVTNRARFATDGRVRFGAPHTLWHRGDLHEALLGLAPTGLIHHGMKLTGVEQNEASVIARFENGEVVEADVLVGADGAHSVVRSSLFGESEPTYTGRLAYRAVVPRDAVEVDSLDPCCKWWGEDRHLVLYHISAGRELAFTTSVPEPGPGTESWSAEGDPEVLRAAFTGFHSDVRAILDAVEHVNRWGIYTHPEFDSWVSGSIALLGDAIHTATPYMGQGAAMAMEDAIVLARSLTAIGGERLAIPLALRRYQETRKSRVGLVRETSAKNSWGRDGQDGSWLYGYDAWSAPLESVNVNG